MKLNKIDLFNLSTVLIGCGLLFFSFQFYSDSAQCLQYQVVWDECRNRVLISVAVLLFCLTLNLYNLDRIFKEYNKKENTENK